MKILFAAGREPSYVRNALMLKALAEIGHEIIDCSDSSKSYPTRLPRVLLNVLRRRNDHVDCVFAGFFGQPLVPILRKLTKKPILFDAFLSAYDTMCFDRKRFRPDSPAGRFFFWLDRRSCEDSDLILLDTDAHIRYFVSTFGMPAHKFQRVFVGADDSIFYPREGDRKAGRFRIFYYTSYLPLHGTEHIIEAAALLARHPEIELRIAGRGPKLESIRRLATSRGAGNIDFTGWIPYRDLPAEIANADICLGGHFSDIEKAKRVIAGKTFQFIAMKKPVILGDCAANKELFTNRQNALMVTMADARSLAEGILELKNDERLRQQIAEAGYKTFREKCSVEVIASELQRAVEAVV